MHVTLGGAFLSETPPGAKEGSGLGSFLLSRPALDLRRGGSADGLAVPGLASSLYCSCGASPNFADTKKAASEDAAFPFAGIELPIV